MYTREIDDYYTLVDVPDFGQSVECTAKAGPADHVFFNYRLRLPSDYEYDEGSIALGSYMLQLQPGTLDAFSEDMFEDLAGDFVPVIPQEVHDVFNMDWDLKEIADWYRTEASRDPAVAAMPFREVVAQVDAMEGIDRSSYVGDLAEYGRSRGYDFNYGDLMPNEEQLVPFGLDLEASRDMLESGYDLYDPIEGYYFMSYLTADDEPGLYCVDVDVSQFPTSPVGDDEIEPCPWEIVSEIALDGNTDVIPADDTEGIDRAISQHVGNLVIASVPDGHYGAFISACREMEEIAAQRDGDGHYLEEVGVDLEDLNLGTGVDDVIAAATEAASLYSARSTQSEDIER